MKTLAVIVLIVICVYMFRHEIVDKIEGEVRHPPKIVQDYNQRVFGVNYFASEQRIALELVGICSQNSIWLNNKATKIFSQNCADAKSTLK
jgi:hypothetical protein